MLFFVMGMEVLIVFLMFACEGLVFLCMLLCSGVVLMCWWKIAALICFGGICLLSWWWQILWSASWCCLVKLVWRRGLGGASCFGFWKLVKELWWSAGFIWISCLVLIR